MNIFFIISVFSLISLSFQAMHFRQADNKFINKDYQVVAQLPQEGRILILEINTPHCHSDDGDKDINGWIYENDTCMSFVSYRLYKATNYLGSHFKSYATERDLDILILKVLQVMKRADVAALRQQIITKHAPIIKKFDQEIYIKNSNAQNSYKCVAGEFLDWDDVSY